MKRLEKKQSNNRFKNFISVGDSTNKSNDAVINGIEDIVHSNINNENMYIFKLIPIYKHSHINGIINLGQTMY